MQTLLILAVAALLAGYHLLMKGAAGRIHPLIGILWLQASAVSVGAVLLWCFRGSLQGQAATRAGIACSIGAGLAVGLAEALTYLALEKGVPVARLVPVATGGSIALAVVAGPLLFSETIGWRGAVGALLVVVGCLLVLGEKPASVG